MKDIDVEEMRVVTNDKHSAEQIRSDSTLSARVENVVMNGPDVGKSEKEQNLKSIVVSCVKSGKVGKLENCKSDEGMLSQSEERFCKSIMRGLVKRNHEKHTMLADVVLAKSCHGFNVKLGNWN